MPATRAQWDEPGAAPAGRGTRPPPTSKIYYRRWRRTFDRVLEACRPGATGADLVDAHLTTGEPLGELPLAYGVGLGYEGAIAGSTLGREFDATRTIDDGSVLNIRILISGETGAYTASETVHVTDQGPIVLSTMSHGPCPSPADAGSTHHTHRGNRRSWNCPPAGCSRSTP